MARPGMSNNLVLSLAIKISSRTGLTSRAMVPLAPATTTIHKAAKAILFQCANTIWKIFCRRSLDNLGFFDFMGGAIALQILLSSSKKHESIASHDKVYSYTQFF